MITFFKGDAFSRTSEGGPQLNGKYIFFRLPPKFLPASGPLKVDPGGVSISHPSSISSFLVFTNWGAYAQFIHYRRVYDMS